MTTNNNATTAARLETFPIPQSGRTQIRVAGERTFDVECIGISAADSEMLEAFFCAMQGAGPFRFEYGNVVHPECIFHKNEATFTPGLSRNNVSFPIYIQPA